MDFTLILFFATIISGAIILVWRLRMRALADKHAAQSTAPMLVEYARALFPILLLVFLLRSFVVEPFRIPSGSMLPSLYVGDFILVNKFKYGIRLPILNYKIIALGEPSRGDVMVFRFPSNPKINYVKRIVGLPGDKIEYVNKKLTINGISVDETAAGKFFFTDINRRGESIAKYEETLGANPHQIIKNDARNLRDTRVTVPANSYFVMGDNRDNSNDSRVWGFVGERNVVGKAFFIWFSWKGLYKGLVRWNRIGQRIN